MAETYFPDITNKYAGGYTDPKSLEMLQGQTIDVVNKNHAPGYFNSGNGNLFDWRAGQDDNRFQIGDLRGMGLAAYNYLAGLGATKNPGDEDIENKSKGFGLADYVSAGELWLSYQKDRDAKKRAARYDRAYFGRENANIRNEQQFARNSGGTTNAVVTS
jgi:hypothetical protein